MKNITIVAIMSIVCAWSVDSSAMIPIENSSGAPCSIELSEKSCVLSNYETKSLVCNKPNGNLNIFFVAYKIIISASIDITQVGNLIRIYNQNQPTSGPLTFPFNPALYDEKGTILPNQKNYFLDLSTVPPTLTQIGS